MDILKKELCFLSKDKIYCSKNDKNYKKELILSPYYYWYFEKKLPISNIKRAKAIVAQMLESSLPKDNKYKFILKEKEKKTFEIYALDEELLISKLQTLGIKKEMISSISFSHSELEECCLELEDSVILSYNNSVAELDKKMHIENTLLHKDIKEFLEETQKLNFKYNFSKGNIVQRTLEIVESNFVSLSAVLCLLLLSSLINIFTYSSVNNQYIKKQEEKLQSQSYATHSVQLKYVMDEVLQLDFHQKNLKKTMNDILKIKSDSSTYISSVEYDDGDWFLNIVSPDKQKADTLVQNKKFSFVQSNKNIFKYEKVK